MGMQETLDALSDPARRRILDVLCSRAMGAGELASAVGLAPSRLSYHLKKLKAGGLVSDSRQGSHIHYELDLGAIDETIIWLSVLRSNAAIAKSGKSAKSGQTQERP